MFLGFYTKENVMLSAAKRNVRRAVRPVLFEDRILAVEQKFFCDRTSEKTVTLTVKDNQDTMKTVTNSTVRLSCQYPLSGAYDLTIDDMNNKENNTWTFVKTNETECEGNMCENKRHENGTIIPRIYQAELWARKDEQIRFHIKFSKGSHVNFTWMFEEDLGDTHPHVKLEDEQCQVKTAPSSDHLTQIIAQATTDGITWEGSPSTGTLCKFPFRFRSVLYYACTNFTTNGTTNPESLGSPEKPITICSTDSDTDFNPKKMGFCDTEYRCPIQCKLNTSHNISISDSLKTLKPLCMQV
jgi:hypothetical protein